MLFAMQKLHDFIAKHRDRFSVEHSNVFAFSFSKVTRHWHFLEIIFQRYVEASAAFIANTKAMQALMRPGTHPVSPEQAALHSKGYNLTAAVHLEIESFYLFSKILLDEIAHTIEYYFGPVRGAPLDSHDDFTKNIQKYATNKGIILSDGFADAIMELKNRISDFRDSQIAHEKSPRTMRGTVWGPDGYVRMASNKLYPKETDRQADTESLDGLKVALEDYIGRVIGLIEANENKTRLTLDDTSSRHTK